MFADSAAFSQEGQNEQFDGQAYNMENRFGGSKHQKPIPGMKEEDAILA